MMSKSILLQLLLCCFLTCPTSTLFLQLHIQSLTGKKMVGRTMTSKAVMPADRGHEDTENFKSSLMGGLQSAYLLNKRVLNKALHNLLSGNESQPVFTSGDCKTVLVACVHTQDLDITDRLLQILQSRKLLTSELLYVGIRYACKKRASMIAFRLLLCCDGIAAQTDTDTVNEVIRILLSTQRYEIAFDILEKMSLGYFGSSVKGDSTSYSLVANAGEKSFPTHVKRVCRVLTLMEKNIEVSPPDESIFLSSLKLCVFIGDYESAANIFRVYENYFRDVKVYAYNILLLSFINRKMVAEIENVSAVQREFFESKISKIKDLQLDRLEELSNLILRFYCSEKNLEKAKIYFYRIVQNSQHLQTSSIIDLSQLVSESGDFSFASELYQYQMQNGYHPLSYIRCMAHKLQIQQRNLKDAVSLLNSDVILQNDPKSISNVVQLAIDLGHTRIANNLFQEIFLRHRVNGSAYVSHDFFPCLLDILESFSGKIPANYQESESNILIEEFINSFYNQKYDVFAVSHNLSSSISVLSRGSNDMKSPEMLSWADFRIKGYSILINFLIKQNHASLALDLANLMFQERNAFGGQIDSHRESIASIFDNLEKVMESPSADVQARIIEANKSTGNDLKIVYCTPNLRVTEYQINARQRSRDDLAKMSITFRKQFVLI